MKDRPATFFFAPAAGALYIFLAGLREFAAMRGPFVGELAHDGLESPLRWSLEATHAYPGILHSNHGEFLFFGIVGTLMYGMTTSPNPAHALDGGIPLLSHFENHWPAASDEHC